MLDFSFGEILVIAIIAIIFLGPDKLPQAFVKVAKFFKSVKKTINEAKETLDREIHISELKEEALEYKKKFEDNAEMLKNNILEDAKIDSLKDDLNKNINDIKEQLNTIKLENKLNEPLEQTSFDEIEQRGKIIQEKLAKPKRKAPKDSNVDSNVDESVTNKKTSSKKPKSTKSSTSKTTSKLESKDSKTSTKKQSSAKKTDSSKKKQTKDTKDEPVKKQTAKRNTKSSKNIQQS